MSVQWLIDCETVLVDDDGVEILLEAPFGYIVDDDGIELVDDDGIEIIEEGIDLTLAADVCVRGKKRSVVAIGTVQRQRIDVIRPAGTGGCCENV